MTGLLTPMGRAIGQLDDPSFLGVLLRALALSALCFLALAGLCAGGAHHLVSGHGWLSGLAGAVGGVLGLVLALFLFLPLALVIGGLFTGRICAAVERRWYPGLPAARGAGLGGEMAEALLGGLHMLAITLASLVAALIPGPGWVVAYLLTGWALGRSLFVAVALRRMSRAQAIARYREQRWLVLAQGLALSVAGAIPVLNLLIPVLGPAAMLHIVIAGEGNNKSWG